MKDFASKDWLREEPIGMQLLTLAFRMAVVFLILALFASIISLNEARAAGKSYRVLLENSAQPATPDECQRARPGLGRPYFTVSHQQRTNEPWHHRTCYFRVRA